MGGFIFPYRAKVLHKQEINHNVVCFHIQKPYGYTFRPGQAIDLSIDQPGYELEVAPFTITNTKESPFLELYIKINPRKGTLTNGLASLDTGATLQITEPWDTFKYKGSGIFIAAGSGITPFIPIFKELASPGASIMDHTLIYANKEKADILFKSELKRLFGKKYINILSTSKARNMASGRIDFLFLKEQIKNFDQYFYICGPKRFEEDIRKHLVRLGAKRRYIQTGYKF
ncbi:MAG TPA: FAD-binding oxidoreductase [Arenibacter sp.]|nr:FAD-binding oxidoreductase [Arenibacter sp.]